MRRITWILCLLLAACGSPEPPVPAFTPPPPVPPPSGLSCQAQLAAAKAVFQPIKMSAAAQMSSPCTLEDGVKLTRTTVNLNRPVEMTCPMALSLIRYETEVMQPTARRLFGQEIATINHAGAFTCRSMTGSNGKRVSEHGHGRAFDIWGFVLKNGAKISVTNDWRNADRKGDFLRDSTRRACAIFSVVLGPGSDYAHRDHLHFDIGRGRLCKP